MLLEMKQFGSHPGRTDPGALSTTACEDGPLIPEKDGPLTPEIAINPIIITTATTPILIFDFEFTIF